MHSSGSPNFSSSPARLVELIRAETLHEELVDLPDVALRSVAKLLETRIREHGVHNPPIARTCGSLDETALLESVEQARDARRSEEDLLGEVDAPHPAIRCTSEAKQHLVVRDRQTVVSTQLCAETPVADACARTSAVNDRTAEDCALNT